MAAKEFCVCRFILLNSHMYCVASKGKVFSMMKVRQGRANFARFAFLFSLSVKSAANFVAVESGSVEINLSFHCYPDAAIGSECLRRKLRIK